MILDRDNSMFKQLQMQKYTAASKFSMNAFDFYISTDEDEEAAAVEAGWTDSPMDFIGVTDAPKRGRKAKPEEPAA